MNNPVVVIGIGEIGSVLARGFLRAGYPVYPVTRDIDINEAAEIVPSPELVVVAVGEAVLSETLQSIPANWRDRLALIQNELLPVDWQNQGYENPTVVSVWFEKKKGQDVKVVVPSPIHGPRSHVLAQAFASLGIPHYILDNDIQLLEELVRKNYYILTSNIAGLESKGTVKDLWDNYRGLTEAVLQDVHKIQEYLTGQSLDHGSITKAMLVAFEGDSDHQCMGRSAPARLSRAIDIAEKANIDVPALRRIAVSM